jgi:superoxide dismutase, Fe-Mn family
MDNMSRKKFLSRSLQATAGLFIADRAVGRSFRNAEPFARDEGGGSAETLEPVLAFTQIPLPYAYDALEPSIDKQTMEIHYTKHHAKYVKEVTDAIKEENVIAVTETDFFKNISRYSAKARNNGGGAWNHNFFWQVMKPGAGEPSGKVADAINGSFGSFDVFKTKFSEAAMKRFGSGWAWLIKDGKDLVIGSTPNQDNPLMDVSEVKGTPVLGLDVWEHAYYLKYQNKRDEYIANWWKVVNWDEVAKRL